MDEMEYEELLREARAHVADREAIEASVRALETPELIQRFQEWRDEVKGYGGELSVLAQDLMDRAVIKPGRFGSADWSDPAQARTFTHFWEALRQLRRSRLSDEELAALEVR